MKCNRTACQRDLTKDKAYYLIWNNPSTGEPNHYCVGCGLKIRSYNPTLQFQRMILQEDKRMPQYIVVRDCCTSGNCGKCTKVLPFGKCFRVLQWGPTDDKMKATKVTANWKEYSAEMLELKTQEELDHVIATLKAGSCTSVKVENS